MAVNIYWASDDAGAPLEQAYDHGDVAAGAASSDTTVYIYHDGATALNSCKLYLAPKSGLYEGDVSALEDFQELLDWGDGADSDAFGGVLVNMNATGSWASGWATWDAKSPTYGFVCRTGVADNEANAQTVLSQTGATSDGVIQSNPPNGYGINVRLQVRVEVPADESTLGDRQFDLVLSYSVTS